MTLSNSYQKFGRQICLQLVESFSISTASCIGVMALSASRAYFGDVVLVSVPTATGLEYK